MAVVNRVLVGKEIRSWSNFERGTLDRRSIEYTFQVSVGGPLSIPRNWYLTVHQWRCWICGIGFLWSSMEQAEDDILGLLAGHMHTGQLPMFQDDVS